MTRRELAELLLDTAATYRLTKLVVDDALTEGLRERLIARSRRQMDEQLVTRRYGRDVAAAGGPVAYLVGCPWCASMYVSAGVVLARRLLPLPWASAARVLSMSAATGWLSERS